ncbi:MarR family winged helix-turn-helix transcriptional regulator [Paenibacillus sp. W2I17]|uniref:MarR family winged helix-turn-helix transcriptional regulator n=1 Tax=Paenibacillus sp. W2I17 TaxID=3042311 RepID=UPI00277DF58B|nr:MarR family transcriptional regulator [Paenibacillus sp. W2I17]MDQ0661103.1 DNA-binding MarR family transcriptional regulator [Paenibacillus sp. W2I17]
MITNYITRMKTRDAISLISKIKEKVNRFILAEMAEQGIQDLATSHGDIIYALYNNHRMTMAEIAKKIGKDKSTVTALVDKLVRTGYVVKERDATDSRVVHVALTTKGEELKPVFEEISQRILDVFYADVTEAEKKELLRILMKIHSNF